jgi:hypothetical protein
MSQVTVKISVSADTTELSAMRRNMGSYRIPLQEGVNYLRTAFQENFDSSGSMVGGWKPLAPTTSLWRAKNGYPPVAPILVNNGSLRAAVLAARGDVGAQEARLTINNRLAPFHQYGSLKGRLPQREIVFEPAGFANLMARRVRAHIMPNTFSADLRALFP